MRLFVLGAVLSVAILMTACGGDDNGSPGTATTAASATEQASADASGTPSPSPTPSATPGVIVGGTVTPGHPLVLAIVGNYVGRIPPISLTDPIACEQINAEYDAASEDERAALDKVNVGRLCILLGKSTFEETKASVFVGFYRSDTGETLNMENQSGTWVITSVTTQAPF